MILGTVVSLQNQHWVLVTLTTKKAKGVVTTKVFRRLNPKPNMNLEEKPYTHAREALCTIANLTDLNQQETTEFEQLKKWRFNVREN